MLHQFLLFFGQRNQRASVITVLLGQSGGLQGSRPLGRVASQLLLAPSETLQAVAVWINQMKADKHRTCGLVTT